MDNSQNHGNIFARSVRLKMWRNSLIIAYNIFLIFLWYAFFLRGSLTIASVNDVIAATASIMIGFSFALSGLCYYFNFLDTKIAYRKYLGLVGFWLAFLYTFILVILNPQKYFYGLFAHVWSADIILGFMALGIFTFMAIISTHWAMRRMGVTYWRIGLRLGYLAYALLIMRAIIIEGDMWQIWFAYPHGLPPLRLIGTVFATLVLCLRGSIIIVEYVKKKKHGTSL